MMSPMDFRHELAYDAPPDQVFAMLADPEFRRAACEAQDVISVEVDVETTGAGFEARIDQVQRTDDLPAFARTFAGDSTQAIQIESWSDATGGSVRIEAPGQPSEIAGTVALRPEGAGTREVVELALTVKVPLIGGKLEKVLAARIAAALDAEHEVGVAYLKGS